MPTVSVILPVYNCARELPITLRNLARQTYADFDVIAIDDGSTDGSGDLLDRWAAQDSRFRVVHQPNAGFGRTLQRACGLATGRYLARQDADDTSAPTRLERQVAYLDAHPKAAVCGTWAWLVDIQDGPRYAYEMPDDTRRLTDLLERGHNPLIHGSIMMRRALCERVGGYRVFNQLLEDYDLWLRLLSVGEPGLVTSVEYLYQISPGGIVYGAQAHSRLMMALVRQLHQERRNGGQEVTDWQATVEKLMPAEGTARASPAERQTAVIYDHGLYCLLVRDWAGYQEAILQAAQGHGAAAERARRQVRWLAKVPPLARWTYLFNVRNTVRRYWRPLPPGTPLPRFAV